MSKKVLTKILVAKREFTYENNGCNLNFILRTDRSSELQSFKAILEEAIKDIEEILKGIKN